MFALRPVEPADEPFLRQVYAGTRLDELRAVGWSAAEREAFLRMQFDAQQRCYRENFPQAEFSIVLRDNVPIGRLYLDRGASEFRIIDIALLPEHRGKGVGTAILKNILAEAAAAGKAVAIQVDRLNPALQLYRRLGFEVTGYGSMRLSLRRGPPTGQDQARRWHQS